MAGDLTPEDLERRRLKSCVDAWPHCQSGDFDEKCCRFPKPCSPHAYPEQIELGSVTEADLEKPIQRPSDIPEVGFKLLISLEMDAAEQSIQAIEEKGLPAAMKELEMRRAAMRSIRVLLGNSSGRV